MKKIFTIILLSLFYLPGISQTKTSTAGIEIDALPYLTGGYYGSIWYGHQHMRYRAIITAVTTPSFMVKDGFTENKINAYTLITDYFFKPGFEKWWIGAGLEYWKGQIQTEARQSTSKYDNVIVTAGGGYVWKFYHHFYLNPWGGIHVRAGGESSVRVDDKTFNPPVITPEVSVKIGWHI